MEGRNDATAHPVGAPYRCRMFSERFKLCVAVYAVLAKNRHVLLMRRAGTGYRDGQLGLPSGHLDGDEDAVSALVRELREELGIAVEPASCRLELVVHRRAESAIDSEYLDLVFSVAAWSGTPSVTEPAKCTDLVWAGLDRLPNDVVDYVRAALRALESGRPLLLVGWSTERAL